MVDLGAVVTAFARVIEQPADGLALLEYTSRYGLTGTALWSRALLRKNTRCAVTDAYLAKGTWAWRPVGNMGYRAERISIEAMNALAAAGGEDGGNG